MTLQQLKYIVALDNYRHFATAAEKCFVAQPTLTLQVKKLEQELNTVIFDRKKHLLQPTPLGKEIIVKARQILREADGLEVLVQSKKQVMQGRFNIGIIPTIAPYLLPLFLNGFVKKNLGTHLVIHELQTEEIIKGLKRNTLDIGLLVTPLEEKELKEVPLYQEPFLGYLAPNHPLYKEKLLKNKELKKDGLLILEEGHCFRSQVLNICTESDIDNQKFSYQSGSIETLKNLVKTGVGFTLVPELSIFKNEFDTPYVRRFEEPQPTREVSLVVHKSFAKEALLNSLRDAIQGNLPDVVQKVKHFKRVKWR